MIRNINGYFDFGGGTQFETLTELIDHYRENPMVEKNGGTVLHLKYVRELNYINSSQINVKEK